jgi:hypothetical protein
LMTLQIFSRVRYRRLRYAFYPEYISSYADNEFTEHACSDWAVIKARHIPFRHDHPEVRGPGWDETYEHTNAVQTYDVGFELLQRRRAAGFPAWEGR